MSQAQNALDEIISKEYEHGFVTAVEMDLIPHGLSEEVVRLISAKKGEPEWLLEWRLAAYRHWLTMKAPVWSSVHYPPIDYQDIIYYAAPSQEGRAQEPRTRSTRNCSRPMTNSASPARAGQLAGVAVDAVFDSVSVATTFKDKLAEVGIIFCTFSEAVREHPELVGNTWARWFRARQLLRRPQLGGVHRRSFAISPGVRCPMELSTYFRINAANTGQFERTLIIADAGAYVSYLEGCTAPMRDENQLHAAVVELVALENAQIKYSTVQNWYPGDKDGAVASTISSPNAANAAATTPRFPGPRSRPARRLPGSTPADAQGRPLGWRVLFGGVDQSSSAGRHRHQDDPPWPSHAQHLVSKGISAGFGQQAYRGLVRVARSAVGARNYTQCDSLLLSDKCQAHTFPYIEVKQPQATVEHEASTSRISADQLFFAAAGGCRPRMRCR